MNLITEPINFGIRDFLLQTSQVIERIVERYPNLIFEKLANQIYMVRVPKGTESEFLLLEAQFKNITIPMLYGLNAQEALNDANISLFHEYPFGNLRGENIIIGFVDTGIDYTLDVFKNEDNRTRIFTIWDQTIEGEPPEGYNFGTEYTKEDIDAALQSPNPYEVVPTRDDIGHGTFLAGVAAGNDNNGYIGGAPDAFIAMVKLRQASPLLKSYHLIRETDIAYDEGDVIAGMNYLLQIAAVAQLPLVICVGIGNNYGYHNGSTLVERYLNSLSIVQGLIVVVAVGNEANSGHHFRSSVNQGGSQDLEINVSPEEVRGFYAYLWASISDKVEISVRSPLGERVDRVPIVPNTITTHKFSVEKTRVSIIYNYPDVQTGVQNINIKFQTPTPGLWTITVYGLEIVDGTYNVWLQRNGFVIETTRFLQPDTFTTLSIPSTSEHIISVGGYDYVDGSIYVGSGRGPNSDGRIKPDLVAPAVNVRGPKPGGGYTTYVGTSTAAAITASASALLMQWALFYGNLQDMNSRIASDILIRGAYRKVGVEYPNPIEGYGRLDLLGAMTGI